MNIPEELRPYAQLLETSHRKVTVFPGFPSDHGNARSIIWQQPDGRQAAYGFIGTVTATYVTFVENDQVTATFTGAEAFTVSQVCAGTTMKNERKKPTQNLF